MHTDLEMSPAGYWFGTCMHALDACPILLCVHVCLLSQNVYNTVNGLF